MSAEKEAGILNLADARRERFALSPDTMESLERAIEAGRAGNVVAIGVAVAYRESGGITRWQTLECEPGQHIYLLGLVQRLAARAAQRSLEVASW